MVSGHSATSDSGVGSSPPYFSGHRQRLNSGYVASFSSFMSHDGRISETNVFLCPRPTNTHTAAIIRSSCEHANDTTIRFTMAKVGASKFSKSKYRTEWTTTSKFGLQVSTRDLPTNDVTSALCLFCRQFGREEQEAELSRKRKHTTNIKYYSYPWRSDNFTRHLNSQHPIKWAEYTSLSSEEKLLFFC